MWQFASPSNESDLTCPNCREDCASHVQIRNTPPREQSDPHKVMRGCASHMNIRTMPQRERSDTHTQSREACTSHIKIRTVPQRERSDPHKVTRELNGFSHFCVEVYKVPRLLQKMNPWQSQPSTLCEPAQSKFTWTSHKGTFVREITLKWVGIRWRTLI
jgi:hypothetical protein